MTVQFDQKDRDLVKAELIEFEVINDQTPEFRIEERITSVLNNVKADFVSQFDDDNIVSTMINTFELL